MEVQPIDVTAIVGIVFGMSVIIIPVLGLTLRFFIKPVLEAYAHAFPSPAKQAAELDRLERRVRELEETLADQRNERLALAPPELSAVPALEP